MRMKSIVDTLVDFAKKLPGFGLVLLIATVWGTPT
jgi:hypothetical protein